jgi:hypothetical protein
MPSFPSGLFPSAKPCVHLSCAHTCYMHSPVHLDSTTVIIICEDFSSQSFWVSSLLHSPVMSSLSDLSCTLFWNIHILCSSLSLINKVSLSALMKSIPQSVCVWMLDCPCPLVYFLVVASLSSSDVACFCMKTYNWNWSLRGTFAMTAVSERSLLLQVAVS